MPAYLGYPEYITAAAAELGLSPAAIADAQRQPALHALSSLVAQALEQTPPHHDTLRRIRELRDSLAIAALAAARITQLVDPETLPPADDGDSDGSGYEPETDNPKPKRRR